MPKYKMSNGEMIDKNVIDRNIAKAKKSYIESFYEEYGYHFCERTKRSDLPLDCSHIISVRVCQVTGRSELAWSSWNIELLNREAHLDIEKWANAARENWYHKRKLKMEFKEFKSLFL